MMKINRLILKSVVFTAGIVAAQASFAQDDVATFVKAGPSDANKLVGAYLNPLFKGLGVGLNSGWANTAHAKNFGRFEFRISPTLAWVPTKDKTFDLNSLGLETVKPTDASKSISPSFAGDNVNGPSVTLNANNNVKFTLPQGAKIPAIPSAIVQASIGLPRGIELTVRGFPEVKIGSKYGKISMLGGGVKINPLSLISSTASKLLPFDIGVAVGFTQLNYKLDINFPPPSTQNTQNFQNQKLDFKLSGVNTQLILSKKLLFFTPFVSTGYVTSKTDAKLLGNYEVQTGATLLGQPTYTTFTDPVKINRTDVKGFRADAGFQLNLAILRVYASYSRSEYESVNVGIGLGLGK